MAAKPVILGYTSTRPHGCSRRRAHGEDDGPHLVQMLGVQSAIAVSGPRDRRIATIAGAQRGRVSSSQLRAAAISPGQITRLVARGQLHRIHHAVYAVGHLAPIPLEAETAALLSLPGAILSHQSAAELWGLRPLGSGDGLVHILVANSRAVKRRGVRVHQTRFLAANDVRVRDGLPVASPARALLDVADTLTNRQLELSVDQGVTERIVTPDQIDELLGRTMGRAGATRLAELLERQSGPTLTRSEAEERMLTLIRDAQLPSPRVNQRLHGYEVDFHWGDERLVVEVDGFRFHSSRRAFDHDRRKDATLQAGGVATMRVTWRQLQDEPYAVVARLAGARLPPGA